MTRQDMSNMNTVKTWLALSKKFSLSTQSSFLYILIYVQNFTRYHKMGEPPYAHMYLLKIGCLLEFREV